MAEANNDRKHNKRELERAIGSITWTVQHVQVVFGSFYDVAMELSLNEQDVPQSYVETMETCEAITAALLQIADVIKKLNETL